MAATSTNVPEMSAILFILIILFVTGGYALACWVKPFTHCHRCEGTGDSPRRWIDRLRYGQRSKPRAARARPTCPHCRGTGLRLRIGRRMYNHLSRIRRDAAR
jgi:Zn finger protein HypA/HybF involved in hydrogenase expression